MPEQLIPRQGPTAIADRLRGYRDRARLTRQQVADRVNISAKLLESWERGRSVPSSHMLGVWFTALGVPSWYRDAIVRLTVPGLVEKDPPQEFPDANDLRALDHFTVPVCYQMLPVFDIIGANTQFRSCFPGLVPPKTAAEEPVNILLWQLLNPEAKQRIVNWYPRTHVLLSAFRIMAPDMAPEDRVAAILAQAQQAPEFDEMWHSDPTAEALYPLLQVRTDAGTIEEYVTRSWLFEFPRRPFHAYMMIPQ